MTNLVRVSPEPHSSLLSAACSASSSADARSERGQSQTRHHQNADARWHEGTVRQGIRKKEAVKRTVRGGAEEGRTGRVKPGAWAANRVPVD
eukprot:scaffold390432_cov35-Prasinocladus_malaysianus.AAC.1